MSETQPKTIVEMQTRIEQSWADFNSYLATLTPEQLTKPTDAAGWTAKDHWIHLAHWQNSMAAMLNRKDRAAAMGIDKTMWDQAQKDGNFDPINAILQQRTQNLSLDEIREESAKAYQHLMDKVQSLNDEDLQRPYSYFQPESGKDGLVGDWLYGNTVEHYDEHESYIKAIVSKTMCKEELLKKIEQGWNDFNVYLMTLTPPQVTVPTDAAGWTALDHVIHVADWENGVLALLNKGSRAAAMDVDNATWEGQDFDKINDLLQKKSKDKTLEQARMYVMGVHQQFVDKIQSMSDDELQRPYNYYQADSDRTAPVIRWIQMNTYEHYHEHMPWIAAIVAKAITKADLFAQLQKGWDEINTFINGLTDEQKTQLTDAAGWTVKDHVIHMAAWEDGFSARMDKKDPRTAMDIDEATWASGDDPINAVIQKRYKDLTWDEVIQKRQAIHNKLLGQIEAMSNETLQGPYNVYNPASKNNYAINQLIGSSTFSHYADHLPWMMAIAAGKKS